MIWTIEWLLFEVSKTLNIPTGVMGIIFMSFGLQLPYFVHTFRIAKREGN